MSTAEETKEDPLGGDAQTDVCIVGAGIAGLAVA
jgi:cation diffusion facilitator CzcD-associated flavoprotein CzcO